jgi:hypothetical protein
MNLGAGAGAGAAVADIFHLVVFIKCMWSRWFVTELERAHATPNVFFSCSEMK